MRSSLEVLARIGRFTRLARVADPSRLALLLALAVVVSLGTAGGTLAGCARGSTGPAPVATPGPSAPVAASAAASATATATAAARAPRAPVALEEYFAIRRISGASFSHDEKLVAYMSDVGGRPDVWVQPIMGGTPVQVTRVEGFVHSYSFCPTADRLVFEADQGGNELPHIYLTDSTGAAPKDLMADYPAGARTGFVRWADDGKSFLYLSNVRDQKYLDLYEYVIASGKSERLWESSGKLSFANVSRDHKRIIIQESISDVDSNLYLLERGGKKLELLTPHQGEVMYEAHELSRDGKSLWFTSDEGREFQALRKMELATKKSEPVLEPEWDVEGAGFSKAWTYFYTVTNVDGTPEVALTHATTGKPVAVPPLPGAGAFVPGRFSRSDRYLAATLTTDLGPATVYVIDLKEGKIAKLAEPLPARLAGRIMVAGKSVRMDSFDGRKVQGFLYEPPSDTPGAGENGLRAAVIDVHGGPTSQSRRRFDPLRQYLVSKGIVVLVPNVRGSTGYGKSFTKLDNLDLGGGPLQDIVACKKYLAGSAKVDPNRVVVLGGSYGGYMALAAAAFTPTEFAASVDYFGVSDLKTLVESFPPYWASFATYIYQKFGDPKNPAHAQYQHDRSPIHFVDRIVRPLLVVQGENDARVKKDQSERIVRALEARKVPVHYLVLEGEGHGFSKNENRLAAYRATDRFLDRYLFGDTTVEVLGK